MRTLLKNNRPATLIISGCVLSLLFACQNKEDNNKPIETAAPEATAMFKGRTCFEYTKGRDTVTMSLVMNANNANGELVYKLHGKDQNRGTFSGTFIGDTLYADYTFQSEGQTSKREAIFLRAGDVLTEGHGEQVEKDGKMSFADPKRVQFDNMSLILAKVDCKE